MGLAVEAEICPHCFSLKQLSTDFENALIKSCTSRAQLTGSE